MLLLPTAHYSCCLQYAPPHTVLLLLAAVCCYPVQLALHTHQLCQYPLSYLPQAGLAMLRCVCVLCCCYPGHLLVSLSFLIVLFLLSARARRWAPSAPICLPGIQRSVSQLAHRTVHRSRTRKVGLGQLMEPGQQLLEIHLGHLWQTEFTQGPKKGWCPYFDLSPMRDSGQS